MSGWFRRHRDEYPPDWEAIAGSVKARAGWRCEACGVPHGPPPAVLTVHHVNGDIGNRDAVLLALCQVCHLRAHGLRPRPVDRETTIARLGERARGERGQLCFALYDRA